MRFTPFGHLVRSVAVGDDSVMHGETVTSLVGYAGGHERHQQ